MPLKSSADKEDKNTSTKLTKSVKVYVLEKDRNTILSNSRLDDNFINESQNILKKQFRALVAGKIRCSVKHRFLLFLKNVSKSPH